MKINEIEKLLGISRANIRYYEKEGLLTVERKDNKYREYSNEDVETLKKIIVLRKIGLSIDEIRKYFNSEEDLPILIEKSNRRIEELKDALKVSNKLKSENTNNFDENYYFDLIQQEEKQGTAFNEIYEDVIFAGTVAVEYMLKTYLKIDLQKFRNKFGWTGVILLFLGICFVSGLTRKFIWQEDFLVGFCIPIVAFLFVIACILPYILLSRKHADGAIKYIQILMVFFCLFIAVALCFGAYLVVQIIKNAETVGFLHFTIALCISM